MDKNSKLNFKYLTRRHQSKNGCIIWLGALWSHEPCNILGFFNYDLRNKIIKTKLGSSN